MRRHQTTEPMRRCIGCRQSKPQSEMMRFTVCGNEVIADAGGQRADGRGYYLCRNSECIENSFKRKSWNRICKSNIDKESIEKVIETALQQ